MFHERTKHIDVRMHFIRNMIAHGAIAMKKILIVDNLVDMMTKLIPTIKFRHCLGLISVGSI